MLGDNLGIDKHTHYHLGQITLMKKINAEQTNSLLIIGKQLRERSPVNTNSESVKWRNAWLIAHKTGQFSETLTWSKVPRKSPREYILTNQSQTLASLRWQKIFGSHVIGKSPVRTWSLKRVGFFSPRVTIRVEGTEHDLGSFVPSMFGGGRLELRDGRTWKFRSVGLFARTYEFVDHSDRVQLSFKIKGLGASAELRFTQPQMDEETGYLLAILAWYVSLLAQEDATAATTVIVCCS